MLNASNNEIIDKLHVSFILITFLSSLIFTLRGRNCKHKRHHLSGRSQRVWKTLESALRVLKVAELCSGVLFSAVALSASFYGELEKESQEVPCRRGTLKNTFRTEVTFRRAAKVIFCFK